MRCYHLRQRIDEILLYKEIINGIGSLGDLDPVCEGASTPGGAPGEEICSTLQGQRWAEIMCVGPALSTRPRLTDFRSFQSHDPNILRAAAPEIRRGLKPRVSRGVLRQRNMEQLHLPKVKPGEAIEALDRRGRIEVFRVSPFPTEASRASLSLKPSHAMRP